TSSKSRRSTKHSKKSKSRSVTVRSGDTLSEIAARNHTTVSKLRKLNNIKGNNIRAGKKLKVK
ncbi:MAG: LysM peptidoglycan-binding domain-containing protein, partial [Prevotella sp.]